VVGQTWDGRPLPESEQAVIRLRPGVETWVIEVEAPFAGDPAPGGEAGSTPGLWDFEVVELFVLDADGHYTEVELGPWGHYLVLNLSGVRQVSSQGHAIDFAVQRADGRWSGIARVDAGLFPVRPSRVNAYAIRGVGQARRFHAHAAVPGSAPDFHRLHCFVAFEP